MFNLTFIWRKWDVVACAAQPRVTDWNGLSHAYRLRYLIGRNTLFLSSPHLCFIIIFNLWFICFPWWSIDGLENLHADRTTVCFKPWQKPRARLGSRKTGLSPLPQYFNTDRFKAVFLLWFLTVTCSCWPYLYFGSAIMLVTYFSKF